MSAASGGRACFGVFLNKKVVEVVVRIARHVVIFVFFPATMDVLIVNYAVASLHKAPEAVIVISVELVLFVILGSFSLGSLLLLCCSMNS